MDVLFCLCADSATVDRTTNRLSIFNVIEQISGPTFPGFFPSLALVLMVRRKKSEPNSVDLKTVGTQDGKKIFELPFTLSFQTHLQARAVLTLQGIPLHKPGVLKFSVMNKNKEIGSWPIPLIHAGQTTINLPATTSAGTSTSSAGTTANPKPKAKKKK